MRHMRIAKESGYLIALYYIGLQDVQMHIDRVASRVEQGGHWIAEEDIRWRYGQSLNNLIPALIIANQVVMIDNTSDPEIIAEIENELINYIKENLPYWAKEAINILKQN